MVGIQCLGRNGGFRLFLLASCLTCSSIVSADDDFADAIEVEVQKLDNSSTESSGAAARVGREELELLLEEEFHGSWVFYQKLSESTRGEVYEEFKRTGSIRSARRMIMNRFLKK